MANSEKKVILLLVEGDSDETLLIDRLREQFSTSEIRFEIINGDIFYGIEKNKAIKNSIGDKVKFILTKRKFKPSNILAVIHILDTDGCFISNDKVIINAEQQALTYYTEDCIQVKSGAQKYNIEERNRVRSKNVMTMYTSNNILAKCIDYQLYYFSRHLEHVIFNDMNPDKKVKVKNIEKFLDELEMPIENYLKSHCGYIEKEDYVETYKESWAHILKETNSLSRCTNTPLLFQYITEKIM